MKNKEKEFLKNTMIVSFGKICTQLITFFLLPLYTSVLSTEEYGVVDLLNTMVSFVLPLVSLKIEQGVFRFLIDYRNNEENQKELISTTFVIALIQIGIFSVLYCLTSCFINNDFKFFLVLNLIANLCSSIMLQICRGLGDNLKYASGSLVSGVVTVVLNVLFICVFKWNAYGMLLATFMGHATCTIYLFISKKIYSLIDFRLFNKQKAFSLLKYSMPLVPNLLSWWIVNASDRMIISYFLGISYNGIYSAANKFSSVITTLYSVFNLTWTESASLYIDGEDANSFFSHIFDIILRLFGGLCLCVITFMPIVFPILINSKFADAYYQIPILIIGSLFNIFVSFLGSIYIAKKKTNEIAKTSFYAAIINMLINFLGIKLIGLYAASISTAVAYMVMFIYRYLDSKKYIVLTVDKKLVLSLGVLYVISLFIYYQNKFTWTVVWIFFSLIGVILLNKKSISYIYDFVMSKLKRK